MRPVAPLARFSGRPSCLAWTVAFAVALVAPAAAGAGESPWTLVRNRNGVVVHTRPVAGSGIREFRGSAVIPASVETIVAILRDADRFKTWFPNTSESHLVDREGDVSHQYSVLDAPWPVSDRDNVFRAETRRDPATGTVSIAVRADPDRLPERPERVRVRHARGEWRLEPVPPAQTRVTFTMHLEPGGGVPEWLINAQVVETPFEALTNLRALVAER